MRLLDKSVNAVRQRMARAREEWEDVERRIRQRMRVYPQKLLRKRNVQAGGSDAELNPDVPELSRETSPELETCKPIVSVHGQDVVDDEIDHTAA
jgi:hypothetical protein